MNIDNFLKFYKEVFLPVYADVIIFLNDKPVQILVEIENVFSHLMVFLDERNSKTERINNLEKAYNHLLRVTLDSYKILWVEISKFIDSLISNEEKRKFVINLEEHEVLKLWREFKKLSEDARKLELSNIGKNNIQLVIEKYGEAIEVGKNIIDSYDENKNNALKKFSLKNLIKDHMIGFIVGVVSGIVATVVYSLIF